MMWLTTMNPETRRLIRVTPADVEETARMFDLLLGDNLQGRKDYIAETAACTWSWPISLKSPEKKAKQCRAKQRRSSVWAPSC